MWGLFAGEARKQPPHIPFSTAIPKDPFCILNVAVVGKNGSIVNEQNDRC